MRPIGHDGYHPTSVAEWLDSIELGDYTKAFLINGYTSMDLLKKIWEVELINVSWSLSDTLTIQPLINEILFFFFYNCLDIQWGFIDTPSGLNINLPQAPESLSFEVLMWGN